MNIAVEATSAQMMQAVTGRVLARAVEIIKGGGEVTLLIDESLTASIAVRVLRSLPAEYTDRITVSQFSEEYGQISHSGSYWRHFQPASGGDTEEFKTFPLLEIESDVEAITVEYTDWLRERSKRSVVIALVSTDSTLRLGGIRPDFSDWFKVFSSRTDIVTAYEYNNKEIITISVPGIELCHHFEVIDLEGGATNRKLQTVLAGSNHDPAHSPLLLLKHHFDARITLVQQV